MNGERVWCRVCNTVVDASIKKGAASLMAPLLGGLGGAGLGARGGVRGSVTGLVLGVLAGLALQAVIPKAQEVVCGRCGGHVA